MTQEQQYQGGGDGDAFIVVPLWVMRDKKLCFSDKLLLCRVMAFRRYWEKQSTCAELLGISERQVRASLKVLEDLGYIQCIGNTGHGKIYTVVEDLQKIVERKKVPVRVAESAGQSGNMCRSASLEKQITDNKYNNKKKINTMTKVIEGKSLPVAQIQTSERKEYGNKDINLLFVKWKEICGFEIKSKVQLNRFACQRLIKSRGLDNVIKALPFVAQSHNDQYAPKIANFMDLEQRWDDMGLWVRKKTATALKQHGTIEI